ncbi:MAG: M28 family peptidase [Flavobacteriales bacterium]|nr:M28 family peptidase [Flavobacteriales bacterium]
MISIRPALLLTLSVFMLTACEPEVKPQPKPQPKKETVTPPAFSADSAFAFIEKQVAFGPRVPNLPSHKACAEWIAGKLKEFGAVVTVQKAKVTAFDGTELEMQNIIGAINPEAKKRILLCAHWDTRPFADKDSLESNWKKPIDGANDGGSGVGVLLELARMFQQKPVSYGVDIVFFDAEDYGKPEFIKEESESDILTWCLGSQYWVRNPHTPGYHAKHGILLDMVGASNATFYKEGYSVEYAEDITNRLWATGQKLGYGAYFIDERCPPLIDDHSVINEVSGIPTCDIIHYNNGPQVMGFGYFHHTHRDNLAIINKNTLKAVGETVAWVVYND